MSVIGSMQSIARRNTAVVTIVGLLADTFRDVLCNGAEQRLSHG